MKEGSSTKSKLSFLDLPPEIRNKIYELTLGFREPFNIKERAKKKSKPQPKPEPTPLPKLPKTTTKKRARRNYADVQRESKQYRLRKEFISAVREEKNARYSYKVLGLMLINKQISAEVISTFYGINLFIVGHPYVIHFSSWALLDFITDIPEQSLNEVRAIELEVNLCDRFLKETGSERWVTCLKDESDGLQLIQTSDLLVKHFPKLQVINFKPIYEDKYLYWRARTYHPEFIGRRTQSENEELFQLMVKGVGDLLVADKIQMVGFDISKSLDSTELALELCCRERLLPFRHELEFAGIDWSWAWA